MQEGRTIAFGEYMLRSEKTLYRAELDSAHRLYASKRTQNILAWS
jgi:hypothetical protein